MEQEDLGKYNPEGSTLRKAQMRMLDMLIEIDKICRKHNIPYWIEYGTLLGAVRHKGFIPWDDDVDISVLQKDYKRLRKVLLEELPSNYAFQDGSTDSYAFDNCGRVRDRKTYCYYPYFIKQKEQGLWVDITAFSFVNSYSCQRIVDFFYRRAYREIHHYGAVAYRSILYRLCTQGLAYLIFPFSWLAKTIMEQIGNHSKHAFMMRWSFPPFVYHQEELFPLVEMEFEGHMFYAPACWHKHLTEVYGDYMQIPSEDKRKQLLDMKKVKFFD